MMSENITERQILFTGPEVRAILEGRKTVIQRAIKPQPPDGKKIGVWTYDINGPDASYALFWQTDDNSWGYSICPYGQPGNLLWVRETWQAQEPDGSWWHQIKPGDRPLYNWAWTNPIEPAYDRKPPRWLPSVHMPRDACRITLEITDVQVRRLWQMTVNDMLAEGVPEGPEDDGKHPLSPFIDLWDSINRGRGYPWAANPWVWVISFKDYPNLR